MRGHVKAALLCIQSDSLNISPRSRLAERTYLPKRFIYSLKQHDVGCFSVKGSSKWRAVFGFWFEQTFPLWRSACEFITFETHFTRRENSNAGSSGSSHVKQHHTCNILCDISTCDRFTFLHGGMTPSTRSNETEQQHADRKPSRCVLCVLTS